LADLRPIYARENCSFCCPLTWGVSVFWRAPVENAAWYRELAKALEPDGIRLLGHRFSNSRVSQFAVSTQAHVAPAEIIQRLKGRLQHAVQGLLPKALKRNFAVRSFGRVTRQTVEAYVASQLEHHRLADFRMQELLRQFQIHDPQVNLSQASRTAHGIYWFNLHVVLVHRERWSHAQEDVLSGVREMILRVASAKGFALSRAAILPDHVHLALGCPFDMAPADVALAFLNNLAFVHGMRPVYQFGPVEANECAPDRVWSINRTPTGASPVGSGGRSTGASPVEANDFAPPTGASPVGS
jgi:REP element-mobilizing transposase RayT